MWVGDTGLFRLQVHSIPDRLPGRLLGVFAIVLFLLTPYSSCVGCAKLRSLFFFTEYILCTDMMTIMTDDDDKGVQYFINSKCSF